MIENIDIGGPTLIRAAAKNHAFAAVVVGAGELRRRARGAARGAAGCSTAHARESLAMEAFAYTARYDAAISRWFAEREEDFPASYTRSFEKVLDLSYGENPHQRAAYYAEAGARTHLLSMVSKLHGKELSFNNLLDLDAGRRWSTSSSCRPRRSSSTTTRAAARSARRVSEAFEQGARHRSAERVRRRLLLQPPGRPGARGEAQRDVRRGGVRARATTRTRSRCSSRSRTCGCCDDQERRRCRSAEQDIKRVRGGHARAGPRHRPRSMREEMTGGHEAQADRGRVGRAAVRDAGVQARALERDRAVEGARDRRDRRGADEPRRLGADRGREGAPRPSSTSTGAAMASDAFFPFADGPADRRSTPACGRSSSRADRARPRGRRGLRRRRRRDGLHGAPPLPPLRSRPRLAAD